MMPSSRCKLDFKCLSLVRTRRECMRRSCFANISFPTINISILGTAPSADVTHYWVTTMMRGRRKCNKDQELKCDKKKVFHLRTNPSCGPRSHHAGPCGARCRQGAEVCQGRELGSTIQLTSQPLLWDSDDSLDSSWDRLSSWGQSKPPLGHPHLTRTIVHLSLTVTGIKNSVLCPLLVFPSL